MMSKYELITDGTLNVWAVLSRHGTWALDEIKDWVRRRGWTLILGEDPREKTGK